MQLLCYSARQLRLGAEIEKHRGGVVMTMIERVRKHAEPCVIEKVSQLPLPNLGFQKVRDMPTAAIMCSPEHFTVKHRINVHMQPDDEEQKVNPIRARKQWDVLRQTSDTLCDSVQVIDDVINIPPNLPDMVFAANAALLFRRKGEKFCVMAKMKEPVRQGESEYYELFLRSRGYVMLPLPGDEPFEGHGDALWHPHAELLWCGYGCGYWSRSSKGVYPEISRLLNVPVIALELVDPYFYHLDTCLCMPDHRTVIYYPGAFTPEGRALIEAMFPERERRIEVTEAEAMTFVCNSIVFGRDIIVPQGARRVGSILQGMDFNVHRVDMSEFLKSGGAARCLVLDHYI